MFNLNKPTENNENQQLAIEINNAYKQLFTEDNSSLSVISKFKCIQQRQNQENAYLQNQINQNLKQIARLEATLYFKHQPQEQQPKQKVLYPRASPKSQQIKINTFTSALLAKSSQIKDKQQYQSIIKELSTKVNIQQKQLEQKKTKIIQLKNKFEVNFKEMQTSKQLQIQKQQLLAKQDQQRKQIQNFRQIIKGLQAKVKQLQEKISVKQIQFKKRQQNYRQIQKKLTQTEKLYRQTYEKLELRQNQMQQNLFSLREELLLKTKEDLTQFYQEKQKMKEQFKAKLSEKDKIINNIVTEIQKVTKYKKKRSQQLFNWLESAKHYLRQNSQVGQAQDEMVMQNRHILNRISALEEEW